MVLRRHVPKVMPSANLLQLICTRALRAPGNIRTGLGPGTISLGFLLIGRLLVVFRGLTLKRISHCPGTITDLPEFV